MISDATKRYLQQISSFSQPEATPDVPLIHVDHVASKIATLYEKLRQVIDYQEDHLLRKNTIERVLKRRRLLSSDPEEIAQPLVFELIRGGYFPNDKIPESRIEEVKKLLAKYIFLLESFPTSVSGQEKRKLTDWLESLATCEIEEKLVPRRKEKALLDYLVAEFLPRLVLPEIIDEQTKKELAFAAGQKALLKADTALLNWRLLKLKFPEFADSPNRDYLVTFSQNLSLIAQEIEAKINHPLIKRMQRKAYDLTPIFLLLQDIVLEDPSKAPSLFENPESLEARIKFAYDRRYRLIKKDNRRWGIRWVISILLSKMFLAFLIEVPYDRLHGNFSPLALGINMLFPPLLMFLIIASIRVPRPENKNRLNWEAMKIIYPGDAPEVIRIEKPAEKTGLVGFFLKLFFWSTSAGIFAGVIYFLLKINFSWLSILIFLAFFSLIAFSGMKIQAASRQLKIGEKEESVLSFLGDVFFLPFRNIGKWLSGQLQKYNLIILILNLFFEAPLQIFFEFLESWRDFLKKKKEEME
ncbi:MAG: hypothetical protein HY577_00310 [Candidatus Nealsonbacteria bacterium]|nr:hypothetical protein [Candidatus Nealsonbacteria bacterium]